MSLLSRPVMPRKVLIVDPNPRDTQDLASAFRQEGFVALEASTFAEGKRRWIEELPEALIAEVRLGEFNGLQLLLRAKLERSDVAVIMTCALNDRVLEAETRRFGGIFMQKPLDPPHVVHLVRSLRERQAFKWPGSPADRRTADRRTADRRASPGSERRIGERRQLLQPIDLPDRRIGERRARGPQS